MTKIVFSKTLEEVTWENSKLVKGDIKEEVKRLKQEKGESIIIFGSGTIVQQLTNEKLIDDYFFVVTPVILGEGKSLFSGAKKLELKPTETKKFKSGNILIHYTIK